MTKEEIQKLRDDADGFRGRFEFQPEHTEDRGIGNVGEFVDWENALVYVPEGADANDHDDIHAIASPIEQHVAEPMARMLNSVVALLSALDRAKQLARELMEIAWRRGRGEFPPADSDRLADIEVEMDR